MRSLIFQVLLITMIVLNNSLSNLHAEKIIQRISADAIPTIKHVYEKEGIVEILIPSGYEGRTDSGCRGKVYFIDDYDNSESIIADIEVIDEKSSAKGKIVKAKVLGKSSTIQIIENNFVRFLNNQEQQQNPIEIKDLETILNKITKASDLCELNRIKSEDIHMFIQNYQQNKNVSVLNNRLGERREKLRKEDDACFGAAKKDIDNSEQEEKVREIAREFHETYPCSEKLSELDRYAESRIEAIVRVIAEKKDNSGEIKGVLNNINEAIRQGNGEAFCRFLNKENDGFYSRERKIIEDFGKEIQIQNSSFDDINITIDGNTASVQCAWNMNFTWNTFPDKKFDNKSRISLKLKKTNNGWEIFDNGDF